MLARKTKQNTVEELELEFALNHASFRTKSTSVEPDDHYPLTCTPENGVWMQYLPGFFCLCLAKSSNLMMFYEGKKSMSMISWSRKGIQAIRAFLLLNYCNFCLFVWFVCFLGGGGGGGGQV